jgi:hypothetical protein
MWLFHDVDWYFVACEKTCVNLSALGIPQETIYEVDPLTCPKCQGQTPAQGKGAPIAISIDDSDSQIPFIAFPFCPDPDYPMDYNRISMPL